MIAARYFSMGLITFCSEVCCEGLTVLYNMQKVLIKWRESRGVGQGGLFPSVLFAWSAAQANLEPVRECYCSGS